MTHIRKFIEKAITGGWRPEQQDFTEPAFHTRYFEYQLRQPATGKRLGFRQLAYEAILLDPHVWQAVAKVEGWYDGVYGPEWLHHMHKMIDALAAGKTLEQYVQSVVEKSANLRDPVSD